ncbi:MAG: hypothetical protein ABIQ61_02680 [Ornithinibacter sp.]
MSDPVHLERGVVLRRDVEPPLPTSQNIYAFEATDAGTRAVFTSTFASAEALQTVLDIGMEEGARSAINQIDGFLAARPAVV